MATIVSMTDGLLVTIVSMIVVFLVLMIIAMLINLLKNFSFNGKEVEQGINTKKKNEIVRDKNTEISSFASKDSKSVDPKIIAAITSSISMMEEKREMSPEVAAAIMAAIKVHISRRGKSSYSVKKIKRQKNDISNWVTNAQRDELKYITNRR